ncbi:MAG: ROK family protein [Candidatus Margulisiibacteriota bacterium]
MYIGIDLGGTKIAAAITDHSGENIVNKIIRPTEAGKGRNHVTNNVFACIDQLLENNPGDSLKAIGIGIPGRIKNDIILNAPNLTCWENINPVDLLQERYKKPVFTDNDANTAALAELLFGAGKGHEDFLYMTISTGIGGGIICNGKLLVGHNHLAGEIGHTIIIPGGTKCGCGQMGCLEAMASGTHLTNRLRKRLVNDRPDSLILKLANNNPELATTRHIAEAALQGDIFAIDLIKENAYYVALGINNYIHMLDPELIIIGGGLANFGDIFFDEINAQLRKIHKNEGVVLPDVVRSPLDQDSGLLGAVALAIEGE